MVNIEDFIKRLEIVLDFYGLNASSFADQIGVQRSSLSHLLSGRNKPSLDFILKIVDVYPEVDLYWILNGKGSFPKSSIETVEMVEKRNLSPVLETISLDAKNNTGDSHDLFSEIPTATTKIVNENEKTTFKNAFPKLESNELEKIVFFYKNGTFKVYIQNEIS
jgi:predicted transcriptional regulator